MTEKEDFLVSFMISVEEYHSAKKKYLINQLSYYNTPLSQMKDMINGIDQFNSMEKAELQEIVIKYCDSIK